MRHQNAFDIAFPEPRMPNIYDQHLARNAANFVALSPVSFVERSAEVFGDLQIGRAHV